MLAGPLWFDCRRRYWDAVGAAVPAANVRLTNAGTGQTREAVTDEACNYAFPLWRAAITRTVVKEGFQTYTAKA